MYFALFVLLFLARAASLDLVCGRDHNCVFERGQEAMKCWGWNEYGQLGYNDTNNRGDDPNEMGANLTFVHIGTEFIVEAMNLGHDHSCAMSDDKAMKCFGRNNYAQLGFIGNTTTGDALPFLEFDADFNLSKIALGAANTCALSTDTALKCFGWNNWGECGAGTTTSPISGPPSQISAIDLGTNFMPIDVQTLAHHVCVKSQQGAIKCFGPGDGRLGYGDNGNRGQTPESMGDNLPIVNLGSNFTVAAIAAGGQHSCALSTIKTVKCWGDNLYGQCGLPQGGFVTETGDNLPVLEFGAGFVPVQLAVGWWHTCILSQTATLICFGTSTSGQLGIGNSSLVDPRTLSTLTGIDLGTGFVPRQVVAGWNHNCAVSTNDTIKCWGNNRYGQLGLGHTNNMGDQPGEMGDDLPFVDVSLRAPTTVVMNTTSLSTAGTGVEGHRSYEVTVGSRNLTCDNISSIVPLVIANATQLQIIIEFASPECDDDDFGNVTFLLTVPSDVPLWNNKTFIVIYVTQTILQKYPDVLVTVVVVEVVYVVDDDDDDDTIVALLAGIGAAVLCVCLVLTAAVFVYMRRKPAVTVVNHNTVINNNTINAQSYVENHGSHAQIKMTATAMDNKAKKKNAEADAAN